MTENAPKRPLKEGLKDLLSAHPEIPAFIFGFLASDICTVPIWLAYGGRPVDYACAAGFKTVMGWACAAKMHDVNKKQRTYL